MLFPKILLLIAFVSPLAGCGSSKGGGDDRQPTPNEPTQTPATKPAAKPPDQDDQTLFSLTEGTTSTNGLFVAKLEWTSDVVAESFVNAKLTFASRDRKVPQAVTDIVFDPQMPSMGHGTSTEDQKIVEDVVHYAFKVSDIYFIMGGKWEIRVTAKVDNTIDTVTFPVNIP